jgi:hypothetical protein
VRATPADGGAKKTAPAKIERREADGAAKTAADPAPADSGHAFVATLLCAFIAAGKVGLRNAIRQGATFARKPTW